MSSKVNEIKLFYDKYIFLRQDKGGIKRYFYNLIKYNNKNNSLNSYFINTNNLNKFFKFKDQLLSYIKPLIYNFLNNDNKKIIYHGTYYLNPFLILYPFKKIITIHDMIPELQIYRKTFLNRFKNKLTRLSRKLSIYNCDHIITPTETTKNDLIRYYPKIKEKNISVIKHGIDHFSDENCKIQSLDDFKNIDFFLYVGSRAFYKGFFDLLDAFSIFHNIYPDTKILCAGSEISKFELNYIKKVNLDLNNLIFYNPTNSELKFLYKTSKAFIYPSRYEGFGFPPLEALISGSKNIICSSIPSTHEICGDLVSYFPVGSSNSLNELLIKAMKSNYKIDSEKINRSLKRYTWANSSYYHNKLYFNI